MYNILLLLSVIRTWMLGYSISWFSAQLLWHVYDIHTSCLLECCDWVCGTYAVHHCNGTELRHAPNCIVHHWTALCTMVHIRLQRRRNPGGGMGARVPPSSLNTNFFKVRWCTMLILHVCYKLPRRWCTMWCCQSSCPCTVPRTLSQIMTML